MAVIRHEVSRRGLARGGVAVEIEAEVEVVDVVDPPAGAIQGEREAAAVLAVEQDSGIERVRRREKPQARRSVGLDEQARGEALGVEEVRAEEELMLAGPARGRLEGPVAEGRAPELDAAGRSALFGAEDGADDTSGAERREAGEKEEQGGFHGIEHSRRRY